MSVVIPFRRKVSAVDYERAVACAERLAGAIDMAPSEAAAVVLAIGALDDRDAWALVNSLDKCASAILKDDA